MIIYSIFILFIAGAIAVSWKRNALRGSSRAYPVYLTLLLPAVFLVITGFFIAMKMIPEYAVNIHGYRVTPGNDNIITIGSANTDDIRVHYRHKGQERFDESLASVYFPNHKQIQISQNTNNENGNKALSENIVAVQGLPLRHVEVKEGKIYTIRFTKRAHRQNEDVKLVIDGRKPIFKYKDQLFKNGFRHEIFFGMGARAFNDGTVKHIGFRNRVDIGSNQLWGQAAMIWKNNKVYLAANDADINLFRAEGSKLVKIDLPDSQTVDVLEDTDKCIVTLYSKQLGQGRRTVRFKIIWPVISGDTVSAADADRAAYVALLGGSQKTFISPKEKNQNTAASTVQRICLTSGESPFRNSMAVYDPHFPLTGVLLHKEGSRFIYRGEALNTKGSDKLYYCGKTIFSIDSKDTGNLKALGAFCLIFILSAFLFPPATIRKEPLIAVVVSASIFLMAFRQILALRAWQGEPWNQGAFVDSTVSPYLFVLCLIVCCERFPLLTLVRNSFFIVTNFFLRKNTEMKKFDIETDSLMSVGALIIFGVIIFMLFGSGGQSSLIGKDFIMVGVLMALFVCVNLFDWIDEHLIVRLNSWMSTGTGMFQTIVGSRAGIFSGFIVVLAAGIFIAPLLGSREVISFIPGRPRPDILLQIVLLILTAYLADVFTKEEEQSGTSTPFYIIALFLGGILTVCLGQGLMAHDLGFFIFVFPPLFIMAIMATWNKDIRLLPLIFICLAMIVMVAWNALQSENAPVNSSDFNRILFCFFKERLRAEYFFDYLANIPVVWASTQSFFGAGFFNGLVDGSLRSTCVNDHVASVFIQGEFGAMGSILTLGIYACIIWSVLVSIGDITSNKVKYRPGTRFHMWILMGLCLMLAWAAIYPFIANMGVVPLTGKNLPLLGLDSKNDVIRYGFLLGFMIRYMKRIGD